MVIFFDDSGKESEMVLNNSGVIYNNYKHPTLNIKSFQTIEKIILDRAAIKKNL